MKNIIYIATLFLSIGLVAQTKNEKNDYDFYQKNKIRNEFVRDSVFNVFSILNYELQKTTLNEKRETIQSKLDSLQSQMSETNSKDIKNEFEYIRKNPSYSEAPNLLIYRLKRREGLKLFDEIYNLNNLLPSEVQNSEKGKELKQTLIDFAGSKIGSNAPRFFLTDINNTKISLNQFEEKGYVLIDFWASWCAPCRQDFPFLKEMYSKYKDKGLNIISLSRDENSEAWRKAIIKDSIELWTHASIKENNSDVEKKYFVNAIPVKILINKEGIIIGKWRGGGEENKEEIRKLFTEIFEGK